MPALLAGGAGRGTGPQRGSAGLLGLAPRAAAVRAQMSTPTPGSQNPNFPMTEVPQKEGPSIPAREQAVFNSAVQVTQTDEFRNEMEAS